MVFAGEKTWLGPIDRAPVELSARRTRSERNDFSVVRLLVCFGRTGHPSGDKPEGDRGYAVPRQGGAAWPQRASPHTRSENYSIPVRRCFSSATAAWIAAVIVDIIDDRSALGGTAAPIREAFGTEWCKILEVVGLNAAGAATYCQRKTFPKCELVHTSQPAPERCCSRGADRGSNLANAG